MQKIYIPKDLNGACFLLLVAKPFCFPKAPINGSLPFPLSIPSPLLKVPSTLCSHFHHKCRAFSPGSQYATPAASFRTRGRDNFKNSCWLWLPSAITATPCHFPPALRIYVGLAFAKTHNLKMERKTLIGRSSQKVTRYLTENIQYPSFPRNNFIFAANLCRLMPTTQQDLRLSRHAQDCVSIAYI